MARYSIVEFDDKTAAIICNSWFADEEEYCLWPNEPPNKVTRLAKAEQQPCTEWKKHKIRVLGKAVKELRDQPHIRSKVLVPGPYPNPGNYERALKKLKLSEETSDLNTNMEEPSHKRRRIMNRKYLDSDSDSESSVTDDPAMVIKNDLPSPLHSLVSGIGGEGAEAVELSALPSVATTSTPRPSPVASTSSRNISPEGLDILTNVNRHPDLSEVGDLRKLASCIYSMKETQQVHTSMLQTLLKKVSGGVTEAATLPESLQFPLETVEQLEEMETHLIDPGVRTGLVNVLGEIGGRNIDECVKRIMRFIVRDTLATKLNMSGKNNKKAFGPTNLFETVYRGVKKNSQTSDCTRKNVECAVSKWLIGGRDRSGNRMRRVTGATSVAS